MQNCSIQSEPSACAALHGLLARSMPVKLTESQWVGVLYAVAQEAMSHSYRQGSSFRGSAREETTALASPTRRSTNSMSIRLQYYFKIVLTICITAPPLFVLQSPRMLRQLFFFPFNSYTISALGVAHKGQ